jgi:predicted ATPase
MHNERDWSNFVIPMKIEKIIGFLIDELEFKDIILLKIASVIGNIFDLDKLYKLSQFNFLTIDDMYSIMQRLEVIFILIKTVGILEFLYDNHQPKRLVCKFAIPFFRDLLYQRMLIEQRNDIHMNVARLMQYAKFSYMSPHQEVELLKSHLKKTEKSIINYMEEEDDEQVSHSKDIKFSTVNNQKIVYVKEVCQKLKAIDMKLDEDDKNKSAGIILQGMLSKKSDSNISWEKY